MSQSQRPHATQQPTRARVVPGAGMAKAGKVTLIIGCAGVVLGIAAIVVAAIILTSFSTALMDAPEPGEGQPVTLEADTEYAVYTVSTGLLDCQVRSPDGARQALEPPPSQSIDADAESWNLHGSFTTSQAGDYTLECYEASAIPGKPWRTRIVEGDGNNVAYIGAIAGMTIGILAVGFMGLPAVVGLILLLVGHSRRKAALAGGPPHPPHSNRAWAGP